MEPASPGVTLSLAANNVQIGQFAWADVKNGCSIWETVQVTFTATSTSTLLTITGSVWGDVAIDDVFIGPLFGHNLDFEHTSCAAEWCYLPKGTSPLLPDWDVNGLLYIRR